MENNINYLRLSLTDRCNLNCIYCTPFEKEKFLRREETLSYEEIAKAVSLFVKAGIRKLRLTGGEPLIKKNLDRLICMLKGIKGLDEISMTTNGVYLKGHASRLKESGIDRINISLDTLRRERFERITGFDYFNDVWQGIQDSLQAGIEPVKLNVILMKGINDDEVLDFAKLACDYHLAVRFIEFFPTNKRSVRFADYLVKTEETKKKITNGWGPLENISGIKGSGPAQYYKLKNSKGIIGFISSFSRNFCAGCNRIRMDCAGRICPCLFSGPTHDVRPLLRQGQDEKILLEFIKGAFAIKSGYKKDRAIKHQLEMSSIGG